MKRVLQIAASLKIGGAEKVMRDIGYFADPTQFEVHYVVFGDQVGDYEQELIERGCKVFHWPSPSDSYPRFYHSLRKLMIENHYDVVHAHTMFNIGWAMLAAKQSGVPVRVAHAHSALSNGRSIKKSLYEDCMRRLILRNATHLVACGNAAGIRLYGEKEYQKRGICILNGIDTAAFSFCPDAREMIREALGLKNAFVIGHVGHLLQVKNQTFLIQLMPEILKRKANAKLVLLGEGEDRPKLERLIHDLRLEDRVIMTGNVRNVRDYLSAMDVFAFPSLFEGMPLSIVEVQANGLPCVLSTGVPKDVYLTDLIQALSLDEKTAWIDRICRAERKEPEKYAQMMKDLGFDAQTMIGKFWAIYQGLMKDTRYEKD